jgi:hypothetical protein
MCRCDASSCIGGKRVVAPRPESSDGRRTQIFSARIAQPPHAQLPTSADAAAAREAAGAPTSASGGEDSRGNRARRERSAMRGPVGMSPQRDIPAYMALRVVFR